MTNNITSTADLTAAATQIDDLLSRPQCEEVYDDPVDLYGGDEYNEYLMGDQGDW